MPIKKKCVSKNCYSYNLQIFKIVENVWFILVAVTFSLYIWCWSCIYRPTLGIGLDAKSSILRISPSFFFY